MFAEAAMGDMRRQETMMKFAHELENREAQQLAQFSQTLFNTVVILRSNALKTYGLKHQHCSMKTRLL